MGLLFRVYIRASEASGGLQNYQSHGQDSKEEGAMKGSVWCSHFRATVLNMRSFDQSSPGPAKQVRITWTTQSFGPQTAQSSAHLYTLGTKLSTVHGQ